MKEYRVIKIADEPLRWLSSTNELVPTPTYGIFDAENYMVGKIYKAAVHGATTWTFAYTDWDVELSGKHWRSFMSFKEAKKHVENIDLDLPLE
tara:strand:- start:1257 stop:1535 length:279 start_codon:yes stop_codon:yes gene_type:complete